MWTYFFHEESIIFLHINIEFPFIRSTKLQFMIAILFLSTLIHTHVKWEQQKKTKVNLCKCIWYQSPVYETHKIVSDFIFNSVIYFFSYKIKEWHRQNLHFFSEIPRACRSNGIHRHEHKEKCTISAQLAFHRFLKSKSHCLENSATYSGRSIINYQLVTLN